MNAPADPRDAAGTDPARARNSRAGAASRPPVDPTAVDAGYAACEVAVRRRAANFGLGIRLLPPERRRGLSAVYWFADRADDAVDDEAPSGTRRARLADLRSRLHRALAGDPSEARWAALADAVERWDIDPGLLDALLDGVERDLEPVRCRTWEDLREYCWGVASTVGLIGLAIFGGRGAPAERDAEELGYALQLTNILRDLREDAARGRWYLPLEECDRYGIEPADVVGGRPGPGYEALIALQAERARTFYEAGPSLCRRLPRSTRACPAALAGVYRGLLERIAADPRAALRHRVRLGAPVKMARGLVAAGRALTAR